MRSIPALMRILEQTTQLMRAVQRRAFGGHAVYSRLDDGILFGVDTAAKFVVLTAGDMELLPKASHFLTMGDALWRSIVARGKDLPVLDQNGTYLSAQTGGALGNHLSDFHKITVPVRSFHRLLQRTKDAVAGITKTGNDIAIFIQMVIKGCRINGHFRMAAVDKGNPFRRGHKAHKAKMFVAILLEHGNGSFGTAARSEHGVDEDDFRILVFRHLAVIFDGLQRFLVAGKANMAHFGFRHKVHDRIKNPRPARRIGTTVIPDTSSS